MKALDIEESLGYWVGMTSHDIEKAVNAELADTGITLRQVQVLACIILQGDLSQNQIAEALRIEASTVVRVLDRMERDGWVTRNEDPRDRRRKIISLTEKVQPQMKLIMERGERIEKQALKGLSLRKISELRSTLATIRANLSAAN